MCLMNAKRLRTNRKKPIICWKVERYHWHKWVSLFQFYKLPEGRSDIADRVKLKRGKPEEKYRYIAGGAFHSFKTLKDAKQIAVYFSAINKKGAYRVVRCQIPPDSLAFKGYSSDGWLSYASRSIIKGKEVYRTGKEEK
jgi:hypothetical protein